MPIASRSQTHEELFLEHYDWLFGWSLQMCGRSKERAEDLLHDLYIQLVQTRPELDTDRDRAKGYLYTMLRHLSISQARRTGREPMSRLRIVDYDSIEFGLSSVDRSGLIFVRSDLSRICEYACLRRKTSRAASTLILRFFLGYYPSELVRLLKTTRVSIDSSLRTARLEAKAYVERPTSIRFMGQEMSPEPLFPTPLPDEPAALFTELRRRIFSHTDGSCFAREEIARWYSSNEGAALSTEALTHLVSCSHCLDLANASLGLTSLDERFPLDMLDRDDNNRRPPTSGGSSSQARLQRKRQATFEHRPTQLLIAVDGEVHAVQSVTSETSELQVKFDPFQALRFVEVLSEQGVRLLYIQVEREAADPAEARHAIALLSDDRSIEVTIDIVDGALVIHALYLDPLLAVPRHDLSEIERKWIRPVLSEPDTISPKAHGLRARLRCWLDRLGFRLIPAVGILSALAFSVGLLTLSTRRPTRPHPSRSAQSLLSEAGRVELGSIPPHGALHQTFQYQVRSDQGKVLRSGKIDSWRSSQPARTADRVFSADGKLTAGQWSSGSASTVYSARHGLKPGPVASTAQQEFDEVWLPVPGPESFARLLDNQRGLSARDDGRQIEIAYEPGSPDTSGIVDAHLVLASDTMQTMAEIVRIRRKAEVREFRFQRLTYGVVDPSHVDESEFEPDSALALRHSEDLTIPNAEAGSTHLALSLMQLVGALGPRIDKNIEVARSNDGLEVQGVLSTRQDRLLVESALRPLMTDGRVLVDIHSNDATPALQPASEVPTSDPQPDSNTPFPLQPIIRSALSTPTSAAAVVDQESLRIADTAMSGGAAAHRQAWHLLQLSALLFQPTDIRAMNSQDRALWLTLLRQHQIALAHNLQIIRTTLAPILKDDPASLVPDEEENQVIHNPEELAAFAHHLNDVSERLSTALTENLAVPLDEPPPQPSPQHLQELLQRTEVDNRRLGLTLDRLSFFDPDQQRP